ncbi:MAG: sigma-54 dependent transcriptional regulator [Desulfobacter sp.]
MIRHGSKQILIVDDETDMCDLLGHLMEQEGWTPLIANTGKAALERMQEKEPDVMLLDMKMPGMDGMEVMQRTREILPDLPIVIVTAYAEVKGAIEAMKSGAHDYIGKPFEHHEVIRVVHRAVKEGELKRKLKNLSDQAEETFSLEKMMGPSDAVNRIISKVNRVAGSDFTVIISGETGSGKELVARAVHHLSRRSKGAFVAVDCGAIPETLIESELFGHEKGSFTGAVRQRKGKFEAAVNGTLLLDEISNMTLGAQAKLLRVLQERVVFRVGGSESFDVDVRVLVSCNQNLEEPVRDGAFRRDLFYRLNDFTIRIPPLRERKEDIPFLANRFMETTNIELGKRVFRFSENAMDQLMAFDWPGNVRQLRAVIRQAVLMTDEVIMVKHLNIDPAADPGLATPSAARAGSAPWEQMSLKEIVRQNTLKLEREVIRNVLKQTGGNKAKAARLLQIDYKTMHTKVKRLGIMTV